MPTTPTTEMIPWSAKKVRIHTHCLLAHHWQQICIVCVSAVVVEEIKRIIKMSEIMKYVESYWYLEIDGWHPSREDDKNWPQKNKDGRQELEIRMGGEHISFEVRNYNWRSFSSRINANYILFADCQNWFPRRCHRIARPRRPACLLLPRPRSEGIGFLPDRFTFQDQANLKQY